MGVSVKEQKKMEEASRSGDESPRAPRGSAPKETRAAPGGSPFHLYKPGQGVYVRWGTAAGLGLLTVAFGDFLYDQLAVFNNFAVQTLIPVALMAILALLIFRYIAQSRKVVDFLIATEGEMKKVSWSTRREVIGATRVVIFTVLALSLMLFIADLLFVIVFSEIGVVRINVLGNMFGAGKT